MTGVEGYIEECDKWTCCWINLAHKLLDKGDNIPKRTMIGSMAYYISHAKMKRTSNL